MQSTSQTYGLILRSGRYTTETRATIGGVVYGPDKLISVSTSGSLYQTMGIGNAAARQINMEIIPQGTIPKRAEIKLEVRLMSQTGVGSEWIQKGIYFFSRRETDHVTGVMTVVGYDAMLKADQVWLDSSYDTESWPMPVADAVADIAERMGVELDSRTVLNGDYPVQYPVDQSGDMTMRAVLRRIAAANGGNWCITDEGKLRLVPLVGKEQPMVTVEITSAANAKVYVAVGDTVYNAPTTMEVPQGAAVTVRSYTGRPARKVAKVTLNGKAVATGSSTDTSVDYEFAAIHDVSIYVEYVINNYFDEVAYIAYGMSTAKITTDTTPVEEVEGPFTDKHKLGQSAGSLEPGLTAEPISRVALLNESGEVMGQAGDDTGRMLEALEPDGTDAMAASILSAVSGYVYQPYEASDALLDPAAELGDLVSIGGITSVLARVDESHGPLWSADISAPTTDEIEDEYPYLTQSQRVQRAISATRSLITKTAEEIGLRVEGLADDYTELKVTLDGVTVAGPDGTTLIKGGSIETSTLQVSAANITGQLTVGNLPDGVAMTDEIPTSTSDLTNDSGFASLSSVQSYIDGQGYTNATGVVSLVKGTVTADYVNALGVKAAYLQGSVISIYNGATAWGAIYPGTNSEDTTALTVDGSTGLRLQSSGGNVYISSSGGQFLMLGGSICQLGGGPLVIPGYSYGTTPPSTDVSGQVFFLVSA